MRAVISPATTDEAIIRQATAVVAAAVRSALVEALQAAEVCRCRQCRAQAVRTFTWAAAMAGADPVAVER
jgi:hypothetical protein